MTLRLYTLCLLSDHFSQEMLGLLIDLKQIYFIRADLGRKQYAYTDYQLGGKIISCLPCAPFTNNQST